ncbi:hypothetical protein Tco_0303522 [Tanacetum coccineum]
MSTQQDIYAAGSEKTSVQEPVGLSDLFVCLYIVEVVCATHGRKEAKKRAPYLAMIEKLVGFVWFELAGSETASYLNKGVCSWSSRPSSVLLRVTKWKVKSTTPVMIGSLCPDMIPEIEPDGSSMIKLCAILLGLPEDIYAAVDSCETAQEIWLRVQQMMKGSDIGIQEKKAKLFNEWERFTSTDGESIESYYHRFSKLMIDFKRIKHFPEKIASKISKVPKQPTNRMLRHVTIVSSNEGLAYDQITLKLV